MPQLQFGDFAPQLIWLVITFTVLYVILSRVALPRIGHVLAERKSRVSGDLERAQKAQSLAKRELEQYDAEIAAGRSRAQAQARLIRERLARQTSEKLAALDAQIAKQAEQSQSAVQVYLEAAASQMEAATTDAVREIVQQLSGSPVTEAEVSAALGQARKG